MNNIQQWNIRGLQANREELNILLSNFNPILVSLQETFLKPDKIATFKNYSLYNIPSEESNGTIHGSIAILVNSAVTHSHIQRSPSHIPQNYLCMFHLFISIIQI